MEPSCPLGGKGTETFHQQAASARRGGVCPGTNLPDGKREYGPAASKGSQPRTQGTGLPWRTRVPISEWETVGLALAPAWPCVCSTGSRLCSPYWRLTQSERLTTWASELAHLTLSLLCVLTSLWVWNVLLFSTVGNPTHTHTHPHTHTHLSSPPHTWMLTGSNSHSVTHPHTPPQQEQILKIHANCPPSRGSAEQVCCHQRQRCPETEFNLHLRHLFLPYASHAHKPQYIWYRKTGRMARPCVSARPQSRKCCVLGWMKSDPVARTWTQEVA